MDLADLAKHRLNFLSKELNQHGPKDAFRLFHGEHPWLRCDRFGSVCWFYGYRADPLNSSLRQDFDRVTEIVGSDAWFYRRMVDRGQDPLAEISESSTSIDSWEIEENGLRYELRSEQGLSPGLFLDQAQNRLWIQEIAAGRECLNLFSYTAGFSLSALRGGAKEATNIDTSKAYLEWGDANGKLNGLSMKNLRNDAIPFLERCARQERSFDLVVCDPPSFSRSKSGVFRIAHDLPSFVKRIHAILRMDGIGLFSTNFEQWDQGEFVKLLKEALPMKSYQALSLKPLRVDVRSSTGERKRDLKCAAFRKIRE